MYLLGYDLGSSSLKASLLREDGSLLASAGYPDRELSIEAPEPGWAEQDPALWWDATQKATARLLAESEVAASAIRCIGISYQMHGLVVLDVAGEPLRPAIIWCDSRAVSLGREAFEALGKDEVLPRLLNSPGNFTASKLAWVKEHEPDVFERVEKMLLPGDYLAYRMTGRMATTVSGLSEGILWDFESSAPAEMLLDHYGISSDLLPELVPTFGEQGVLTARAASELGLAPGTLVSYRAGDQPNNALSLNVLEPGEIAATAGTSGVVYGVSESVTADPRSRVNSFAHVNHARDRPRLGVLLCINGCGASNRWIRDVTARGETASNYDAIDRRAAEAPVGSAGLYCYPFGNGAERMLENRELGGRFTGIDYNRHHPSELYRSVQEGVAFAFKYGMEVMAELDVRPEVVRAGRANLFRSPLFREAFTEVGGMSLELYDTDGSQGAARGAGIGIGHFRSPPDAFESLRCIDRLEPGASPGRTEAYHEAYAAWREGLERLLA